MSVIPPNNTLILLAEDDADDRLLFREALNEIDTSTSLSTVSDGEELMTALHKNTQMETPFIIFLDLNMPKKNGFECLQEIRKSDKFKDVPVVVFSTSCQQEAINKMYENGASYYICKPNSFVKLKTSIEHILSIGLKSLFPQPPLKDFVIAY